MRAVIQTATGKAEEEPIVELSATTTTPPVVVLGADPPRQRSTGHALAPYPGCHLDARADSALLKLSHHVQL